MNINSWVFLSIAFGLNCWECDTRDYSECVEGENLPSSMYRHCDDVFNGPPVCIKVVSLSKWSELLKFS